MIESKNAFDTEKNLFCKIVIGDKSDNIPGIFNKCGIKTEKLFSIKIKFIKMNRESSNEDYQNKLQWTLISSLLNMLHK